MVSDIETSLRRRMYATIALFVVCAVAFVATIGVLYGWVVPSLLEWWGRNFTLDTEIGIGSVVVVVGVVVWLSLGSLKNFYASPLDETNARTVSKDEYPDVHATVRRLAQQADVPAPDLAVVPTDVANAYTVGVRPESSTIVVTEGLLEKLDADEREAVLAHELAHITNRDGAVMSIGYILPAATFAVTKALTSPFDDNDRPGEYDPEDGAVDNSNSGGLLGGSSSSGGGYMPVWTGSSSGDGGFDVDDDGGGGGGIIVAILVLLAILALTLVLTLAIATFFWVFSYLTLILLARTREYAADYGAVELTGDPDALANALTTVNDDMDEIPLQDLRECDGAVETLYFMPLRRGMFSRRDIAIVSDELFPKTHPDTQKRIDRIYDATTDQ